MSALLEGWVPVVWRKVETVMPTPDCQVIFLPRRGFGPMQMGWWSSELDAWDTGNVLWSPHNVSHWAALPPLPAEAL